jgi:zinc protease
MKQIGLSMRRLSFVFGFVAVLAAAASPAEAVRVQKVVSPGGIEAWFVRDTSVPLIAVEFLFRGGATLDPKDKAGRANLVSSLLDEGAGDLDSQACQARLRNLSIRLGFNAGHDHFSGSLRTLNRNRAEAVRLLRLALTKPRFDPDPVERMRSEILAETKRRASRPGVIVRRTWQRAMFGGHPYGRSVRGTEETLRSVTVEDMRAFMRTRLAKDRLIVGVSGDITVGELETLLDEAFGGLPAKAAAGSTPVAQTGASGDTFVVEKPVPQSVAVFGLPGLSRKDSDYYAAYVMNHILGGGTFGSRMYREIREKRGLAYSVYSYLDTRRAGPLWMGSVATANSGMAQSIALVRDQVRRMQEEGVSAKELEDAKLYLNGSFPLRFTSSDRIASILVAMQYEGLGIDYLDQRAKKIDAVTRADIARVAKRLLDPRKLTVIVVGKPNGIKPTAEAPDTES